MSNNVINGTNDGKVEKLFEDFKIVLIRNVESLIISISKNQSLYVYDFNYNLQFFSQINTFKSKNNIKEIEELIISLIDEKKIKITINDNKTKLKFILNNQDEFILNKKRKKSEEIIDILIDKIENLENENKELNLKVEKLKNNFEAYQEQNHIIYYPNNQLNNNENNNDKNNNNNDNNNDNNNKDKTQFKEFEQRLKILEDFHFTKGKKIVQIEKSSLTNINLIKAHDDWINSMSVFPSGNIISVSDDFSIKIFNIHFNLIQTIEDENKNAINYVEVKDDNNFITCSSDETIKFWIKKDNQFELDKIIKNAHEAQINKVIYYCKNQIISCSKDKTIKIWEENNEIYKVLNTLEHSNEISSILFLEDKNMLISAGEDNTKFWDLDKKNDIYCKFIIEETCCQSSNGLIRINDDNIITCYIDFNLCVISIGSQKIIKKIKVNFQCFGIDLIEDKGVFLVGGMSNNIRVYRKDNFECIQIIKNAHNDKIIGFVELINGDIASYSADKTIKIWKF